MRPRLCSSLSRDLAEDTMDSFHFVRHKAWQDDPKRCTHFFGQLCHSGPGVEQVSPTIPEAQSMFIPEDRGALGCPWGHCGGGGEVSGVAGKEAKQPRPWAPPLSH